MPQEGLHQSAVLHDGTVLVAICGVASEDESQRMQPTWLNGDTEGPQRRHGHDEARPAIATRHLDGVPDLFQVRWCRAMLDSDVGADPRLPGRWCLSHKRKCVTSTTCSRWYRLFMSMSSTSAWGSRDGWALAAVLD